ncbi:MAG: SRPBCC domain-containing protein [Pseudomonadota bacterium]
MTDLAIEKTIYLRATPARVWDYLTDPDKLAMWFHKPKFPLLEGSYEMMSGETDDRMMWGEVQVAEPYSRLEYTFCIPPLGDRTSTVKWTLEEVAGGTKLSLRHEGLPASEEAFGLMLALDKGWDEHLGTMREAAHGE